MDDDLRTYYYFWKYANLTPSEVYRIKKENYGEYKLLRVFLIQRIEEVIEEKKHVLCPFAYEKGGK